MSEFPTMQFLEAQAICPPGCSSWPEGRETSLYWMARKRVMVDARGLGTTLWRVAADRHYVLYLNGVRAARQLGYFSGDQYLFGQEYGAVLTQHLRPGANDVEVLVRSDPWGCKNYRPFQPAFWLEALDEDGTPWLFTDGSWETASITGWRDDLFLSTTQLYEHVHLSTVGQSGAGNVPCASTQFASAAMLQPVGQVPDIYAWTDRPKETVWRSRPTVIACGGCQLPFQALHVDMATAFTNSKSQVTLACDFDAEDARELALAATAIRRYRVRLNGMEIGSNSSEPDYDHYTPRHTPPPAPRRVAGHYHYVRPVAHGCTRVGHNRLEIVLQKARGWNGNEFRLAAAGSGREQLMNLSAWCCDGGPLTAELVELSSSDRMSALLLPDDRNVKTESAPWRVVCAATGQPQTVLLDLGSVSNSFVSFTVKAEAPGRITLAYGRVRHGGAVDCACMNRRAVDVFDVPSGLSRFEGMDWRHFRYLSFLFEGFDGTVELSDVQAEESVYLSPGDGDWASNDGRLDRIWRASLRTAQLCGHAVYMDNPDREQAQWIDNYTPNMVSGYYWFAETRKPAKVLREATLHQADDGQIQGYAPGLWHRGVPPYQCHLGIFAHACRNHLFHSGDMALGRTTLEALLRVIRFWRGYRREDGLIHELHTVFVDWGAHFYSYAPALHQHERPATGALTAMNAYCVGALRAATAMAGALNEEAQAAVLEKEANDMAAAIRVAMYDQDAGWFRDGIGNPEAEDHVSQAANALAVWFGAAPEGEAAAILKRCFGADAPTDIIRATPHFTYQAGSALFEAGCDTLALDWIRRGFGPMVDQGSQTLWESFGDTISLCQGTGAAVAYHLGRYVAGLYPVTPGYGTIGFAPQPGDLRRMQARLRTPAGPVDVQWKAGDDGMIEAVLGLPATWRDRRIVHPPNVSVRVSFAE